MVKPRMKLLGMTNVECRLTNDGIASLSLFKIDRIHYSTFDVECSMFDQFLIGFDLPFFWPAATLV